MSVSGGMPVLPSPLMLSCSTGNVAMIAWLLDNGADINHKVTLSPPAKVLLPSGQHRAGTLVGLVNSKGRNKSEWHRFSRRSSTSSGEGDGASTIASTSDPPSGTKSGRHNSDSSCSVDEDEYTQLEGAIETAFLIEVTAFHLALLAGQEEAIDFMMFRHNRHTEVDYDIGSPSLKTMLQLFGRSPGRQQAYRALFIDILESATTSPLPSSRAPPPPVPAGGIAPDCPGGDTAARLLKRMKETDLLLEQVLPYL
eukprot:GHVU01076633.1.p1 GENE.GHVU01076633.1~~GHVU01076633.1.p1  ORF type:complete len:254 (+),score=37.83 GHVU01076633.1:894-1655(+)